MFLVPFDRSHVAIPLTEHATLLVKFRFRADFSIFVARHR
jgi:hypothetical protein